MVRAFATGLVLLFMTYAANAAETIARRHDKPLSGEVTAVSKTDVTVRVKNPREETITIPANEVQNISFSGEPPEGNLARGDEAAGRYQRAIEGYEKTLAGLKGSNSLGRIEIEYSIARAMGKQALLEPSKADDAIKRLEDFRARHGDHYRYFDATQLLGRLYLSKNDFVQARAAFDALARAPWKETQMTAKVATGRLLLADNKPNEALAAFDEVAAMPANGLDAESQRLDALLGKARVLLAQRKFGDAQTVLEEVVDKAGPEDTRVNAEAYIRLGDAHREQGHDVDALLEYLKVDLLFPSEKACQAEALFHLVRLFERVGQKGRAVEARDRLESDEFRDSEWARQLKSSPGG